VPVDDRGYLAHHRRAIELLVSAIHDGQDRMLHPFDHCTVLPYVRFRPHRFR
jgi:hypothetical protein